MLLYTLLPYLILTWIAVDSWGVAAKPHGQNSDLNFVLKRKHRTRHHHGMEMRLRTKQKRRQNDAAAPTAPLAIPDGATVADNATLQRYIKSNCSSCIMREEAKHARIAQIKAELMQKLGFTKKLPTANASHDFPSYDSGSPFFGLLQRYGYQSDSPGKVFNLNVEEENVVARTERIYSFAKDAREKFQIPGDFSVGLFEFSDQSRANLVKEAKLNIYIRRPEANVNAVSSELTVEICEVNKTGQNMYLDILTEEGEKTIRKRRNAMRIDCKEENNETRCCRYPLVIDFEKFGWDFVIAPKKYLAYYCSGTCPFKYLQRYVHTHLVQQALPDGSGGPCCYPTEMAPIMMVYLNDNKEVLVSQVPGMVATRCGCA